MTWQRALFFAVFLALISALWSGSRLVRKVQPEQVEELAISKGTTVEREVAQDPPKTEIRQETVEEEENLAPIEEPSGSEDESMGLIIERIDP